MFLQKILSNVDHISYSQNEQKLDLLELRTWYAENQTNPAAS
jgi:hypothetical protein